MTFVQRFGSPLNLNCHAHALLPEGGFAPGDDGRVTFHPLPPPWDDDVERLVRQVARGDGAGGGSGPSRRKEDTTGQ